jgi:carbamoyltransferase
VATELESGHRFDTILANPPFVPSPKQEFRFRDGGATGEEILAAIVKDSGAHLTPTGRLFIVTDLVDISRYETKLERWWNGGTAHKLVLGTADRDDILFSVPHSHAAFGQSFAAYNAELEQWIGNFHGAGLQAVNFGYILIQRATTLKLGSYYRRTIHNPSTPIHTQVATYFQQRQHLEMPGQLQLVMAPGICFQMQLDPSTGETQTELLAPGNDYFTTYPISPQMVQLLQEIRQQQPQWRLYATPANREILQDLVCKGILQLVAQPAPIAALWPPIGPLTMPGARAYGQGTPDRNGNGRAQAVSPTAELSIAELQTKTTPTCLSSYL